MTKAESLLDIGYYRLGFFSFPFEKGFLYLKWLSVFYIFDENDKNVKWDYSHDKSIISIS